MNMFGWFVAAPIVVPLLFAALTLMLTGRPVAEYRMAIIGGVAGVASAVLLATQVGLNGVTVMWSSSWAPPFGIALVADALGAGLALITAVVGLAVLIYGTAEDIRYRYRAGFYPLVLALLSGVSGAFLTADIFNLYVWFEIVLITSLGLMILGGAAEQIDGAVKYGILSLIATTLFLIATGFLYGIHGTLSLPDLAIKVKAGLGGDPMSDPALIMVAALYLMAFGMKAAAFPLFMWLPASYHTPKPASMALFAGLLTKVGVYSIYRVFSLVFVDLMPFFAPVFLTLGVLTLLFGALGVVASRDMRRMMGWIVISGIGFLFICFGFGNEQALTAGLVYMVQSMVFGAIGFLIIGIIGQKAGTYRLDRLGGIWSELPAFGAVVLVLVLALAGLPPFLGFWPKLMLVQSGWASDFGMWPIAAMLVGSFITMIGLGRFFAATVWRAAPAGMSFDGLHPKAVPVMRTTVWVLLAPALLMGLYPEPLIQWAQAAAQGLADPSAYIDAILPSGPITGKGGS
ncbi:MAG: Na+/H+ antiporter subunit D [Alphaproteobacteria bacterium]